MTVATSTSTSSAGAAAADPVSPATGIGAAPPSPAGPEPSGTAVRLPPGPGASPLLQGLRFGLRPMTFHIAAHRRYGDVWTLHLPTRQGGFVLSCHPDHLQSLMTARPGDAPSLTGESPLRPILGPDSVLTSVGERHLRQRKLLLPPFHGEAIARYIEMIREVAEREIDSWRLDEPFGLGSRMQAVTLEVIMRGVFGLEGRPTPGTPEHRMRQVIRRLLGLSANPVFGLLELRQAGRPDAKGLLGRMVTLADRQMYALIAERRRGGGGRDDDVLSLLLAARDEDGQPLTDRELRDELMSLLLAGHETTANALAWTFERLLRYPEAYARLRDAVRGGDEAESAAHVEATIHEAMRNRPVIPMIVRLVTRPWRFGDYVLPARTPVGISIIALHHRSDIYPEPNRFAPERFLERKPGTYTWIPFGGGIRRCLGASLAMAEQRIVVEAIARRADLVAPDPAPESPRMRNVTMIPGRGCRVAVAHLRDR